MDTLKYASLVIIHGKIIKNSLYFKKVKLVIIRIFVLLAQLNNKEFLMKQIIVVIAKKDFMMMDIMKNVNLIKKRKNVKMAYLNH